MVIRMKNEKKVNRISEFWKKRCDLCPANLAQNITTKKTKTKTKTKKQNKTKQNKTKDKQTNK